MAVKLAPGAHNKTINECIPARIKSYMLAILFTVVANSLAG